MTDRPLKRNRYPYRLILDVVPLHVVVLIRFEIRMLWVRLTRPRRDRRFAGATDLLVNLGSGPSGKAGWVNVDGRHDPGVTCVADLRHTIPLPDGSARAIFTEHLVEHLDYDREVPGFLAECMRVLRRGGVLRVVVPDGERYLLAYAEGTWDALQAFSPLAGFATRMEVVNFHFRQGIEHRFSYDAETLQLALRKGGFESVTRVDFGESRLPELAIDEPARASESLYIEATKPA
jgi:predicted SAM-dependent methyltransferase